MSGDWMRISGVAISSIRVGLTLALLSLCGGGVAAAATAVPTWDGDPFTTHQRYDFETASQSPVASDLDNSYGVPVADVGLGNFAAGWQDPVNPIDLSGSTNDGAWDLGILGYVEVEVPFAPGPLSPGSYYRVDFHVRAIAYQGITALPDMAAVGMASEDLVFDQSLVAPDPGFPGASWQSLIWTGYFDNVTSDRISFRLSAPALNTSVVDSFEVSTRYVIVPEPSSLSLLLGSTLVVLRRRRP